MGGGTSRGGTDPVVGAVPAVVATGEEVAVKTTCPKYVAVEIDIPVDDIMEIQYTDQSMPVVLVRLSDGSFGTTSLEELAPLFNGWRFA